MLECLFDGFGDMVIGGPKFFGGWNGHSFFVLYLLYCCYSVCVEFVEVFMKFYFENVGEIDVCLLGCP